MLSDDAGALGFSGGAPRALDLFARLPNLISLARLCLAPLSIALISSQAWGAAFYVFLIAGLSDALDGWLAKTFHLTSELGAYLDPLADKALLVSIYVSLAMSGHLPPALAILVVSRDIMIVAAVVVAQMLGRPMQIRPLFVSKLNTAAQIGLAGLVLGMNAYGLDWPWLTLMSVWAVAALTLASAMAYLLQWSRHMGA